MSEIFKQSLKSSIYSVAGVLLGFVTTSLLMPEFLSAEEIGVVSLIRSYGMILSTLFAVGLPTVVVRFFPYFQDRQSGHSGYGAVLLLMALLLSLLLTGAFPLITRVIAELTSDENVLFENYLYFILPMGIAGMITMIFQNYASALKLSSLGTLYREFFNRVGYMAAVLIFIFASIEFQDYLMLHITAAVVAPLLLIVHLFLKKEMGFRIDWKKYTRTIRRESSQVAAHGFLAQLGTMLVLTLDSIMISTFKSGADVGIYTTVYYFASLMLIPARSLTKIGNAFLAEKLKEGKMDEVESIYFKSCQNQGGLGAFMFINLIILLPVVFAILPDHFNAGYWVVFFLGLANFSKLATGMNFPLIGLTTFHQWRTYLMVIYIAVMVGLNVLFIPHFGIGGAAAASFIANVVFHYSGVFLIHRKLNFSIIRSAYTRPILLAFLLGIPFYIASNYFDNYLVSIALAGVFSVIYGFLVYKFNLLPDVEKNVSNLLKKLSG